MYLIAFLSAILMLCQQSVYAQTYKYDDLGRVTETNYPDSIITRYTYDANGNRISQITTTPVVTTIPVIDSNVTKLLVFPNPTTGTVTVNLELRSPDNVVISCYTIDGKLILQERFNNIQILTKSFRLNGKASGIYHFIVSTKSGNRVWRIEKL